jgi:phosphoribosylanthranilate isomerase
MTVIKICGIVDVQNGVVAIDAGAEYLGFVFYPPSSRALDIPRAERLVAGLRDARPSGWQAVGVFVNEPLSVIAETAAACGLDIVQLNGEEPADYIRQIDAPVFKALRFHDSTDSDLPTAASIGAARVLLDANVPGRYGGTGVSYDWSRVSAAVAAGFLAGGLTPDNVAQALDRARPWGVDVSSGVEHDGVKSPALIEQFIAAVRRAEVSSPQSQVQSRARDG